MKILIDIPEEFEVDYNTDRFADFFQRCLADMGTCCGNYEQETAEMMIGAFEKSRIYDPDKVVEQLEEEIQHSESMCCGYLSERTSGECAGFHKAIEIVKRGGVDGN